MKFYDIGESPLMGHSEKCIAPLLLGGIIAAGASLAGNAIGASSQNKTNETSKEIAEMNNKFNAEHSYHQADYDIFPDSKESVSYRTVSNHHQGVRHT
jgi:hypothetical protein